MWHIRELVRRGESPPKCKGEPMDMWSIGVCLLILLRGNYPYSAESAEAALAQGAELAMSAALATLMVAEVNQLAAAGRISADCHRILTACFAVEPTHRPTAAQLLQDRWILAGVPYPQPACAGPPPQSAEQLGQLIKML